MLDADARRALESMMRATEDDATPIIRRLARIQARHILDASAGGDAIPAGEEWPVKWAGPLTVGNMIANLRTLPADMPIHSAYHLVREGKPARLFVKHPTVSRERVDGREIKTGDESVPYSAVIWSHGREPEIATPKPPAGGDAGVVERLDALTVERCAQVADMVPDDMIRHSEIAERIRALALPAPVVEGDVERLVDALRDVRDDLNNENGLNLHSIADVIWHGPAETTVDFIDATLAVLSEGRSHE